MRNSIRNLSFTFLALTLLTFSGKVFAGAPTCGDEHGYNSKSGRYNECDDGNLKNGDGCDSNCQIEIEDSINAECYKANDDICQSQIANCLKGDDTTYCRQNFKDCLNYAFNHCGEPVSVLVAQEPKPTPSPVPVPKDPETPPPPQQEPPPPAKAVPPPAPALELSGSGCSLAASGSNAADLGFFLLAFAAPILRRRTLR